MLFIHRAGNMYMESSPRHPACSSKNNFPHTIKATRSILSIITRIMSSTLSIPSDFDDCEFAPASPEKTAQSYVDALRGTLNDVVVNLKVLEEYHLSPRTNHTSPFTLPLPSCRSFY